MNMLILSLHIAIATLLTITMAAVFAAAYNRKETKAYAVMLFSFAATVVSGVSLLFVSAGNLGRICAMMSAFSLLTFVARTYYRRHVTQSVI